MEETKVFEPKIRVNVKQNYKGDVGGEYTCRADTIEELKKLLGEVREIFRSELKKLKCS